MHRSPGCSRSKLACSAWDVQASLLASLGKGPKKKSKEIQCYNNTGLAKGYQYAEAGYGS